MAQPLAPTAGVVASILCAELFDGPTRPLPVLHRGRQAAQVADEQRAVVGCVITPAAVRLPHAIVLPDGVRVPSSLSVGDGALQIAGSRLRVARWFRPARPRTPGLRGRVDVVAVRGLAAELWRQIGQGPGLTPYSDDVICGALVACHASAPELCAVLGEAVAAIDLERRTTAASALLLRAAAAGWCVDAVADYLQELEAGGPVGHARTAVLALGHTSGTGVLAGIHRVLPADARRAAA